MKQSMIIPSTDKNNYAALPPTITKSDNSRVKRFFLIGFLLAVILTSCTKRDYVAVPTDPYDFMKTREKGIVVYVDYFTGNYIVDTYSGYAVIESFSQYTPREYDEEYAFFSSRGLQTIYNWSGDFFYRNRVVDSWLRWNDALYLIDHLSYR